MTPSRRRVTRSQSKEVENGLASGLRRGARGSRASVTHQNAASSGSKSGLKEQGKVKESDCKSPEGICDRTFSLFQLSVCNFRESSCRDHVSSQLCSVLRSFFNDTAFGSSASRLVCKSFMHVLCSLPLSYHCRDRREPGEVAAETCAIGRAAAELQFSWPWGRGWRGSSQHVGHDDSAHRLRAGDR